MRSYETHPFLSDLSDGGAAHEYTPDAVAKLTFTVALVEATREEVLSLEVGPMM